MPDTQFKVAHEAVDQAKELLAIFPFGDWESLSAQQQIAAGLLGRWVIERLLRAYAFALGRVVPVECPLDELHRATGLSLSLEADQALPLIDEKVRLPEPFHNGWEADYEMAFLVA